MKRQFRQALKGVNFCVYCGGPNQVREHYLIWASTQKAFWLPACSVCNHLLGKSFTGDRLGSRASFLKKRYKKRFKRLLNYQLRQALPGTKGRLWQHLRSEMAAKEEVKRRLEFLGNISVVFQTVLLDDLAFDREAKRVLLALQKKFDFEAELSAFRVEQVMQSFLLETKKGGV